MPVFSHTTLPESFQGIGNTTKPSAIGGIHATASSDRVDALGAHIDADLDGPCHAHMLERQPSRVLVVVAGSNADVVGTTLAAFLARDRASVDELHVLAPVRTGQAVRASLLRSPTGSGPLTDVYRRLGLIRSDVLFGARTIHVLGAPSDPIAAGPAADDALEVLRGLCTGNNEVAVVAAPDAGPLGVLAYAVLQFVGRPRDRFFFLEYETGRPPDPGGATGGGKARSLRPDLSRKRVLLSELPTVLAVRPLESSETFQQLAESRRLARQRLSEPGNLFLNGKRRSVRIDDTEFTMPRLQFFWFFALATLAPNAFPLKALTGNFQVDTHGRVTIVAPQPERAPLETIVAGVKKAFVTLFPHSADEFSLMFKRACGPSPGLPSIVAKINARLRHVLGIGATPYLIAGGRTAEGYRLTLAPAHIKTDAHISGSPTRN